MRRTAGSQVSYESSASDPGSMLMKVPGPPEPQESRTDEPNFEEKHSAREAGCKRSWAQLALR